MIGFDATEDHRTYATGGGIDIGHDKALPKYADRYVMRYPLREWGFDRAACCRIILAAGLPLPPKSACFFCPSMKQSEIDELERTEPSLFALALEMQRRYRAGRHFRGDNVWTVKAVHKQTKETVEIKVEGQQTAAAAREEFRSVYGDTVKPYRYKVAASAAVVGLGRDKVWAPRTALPLVTP